MKCIDCRLAKNTLIFGVLTLIVVVLSYNFLDIKVANIVHTSDIFGTGISTIADLVSKVFSPKMWTAVTVVVTFVSAIIYFQTKNTSSKFYTMSLALIATIVITTIVKVSLARYRPEMLLFDDKYGFHFFSFKKAYNSMPSGHTALSFAGLLAIANFFKKSYIYALTILLACVIAISRIIILNHFVSDVILAAYIGVFCFLWAKSFVESKSQ